MLAFFAIFPPEEIIERIEKIRKVYDKKATLAPHITIVPPFTPKIDMKSSIEELEKILKIINPFEIEISGVGSFRRKLNSVCYFDVVDSIDLIDLQNIALEVLESVGAKREKFIDTNFHITITKRLGQNRLDKIIQEINRLKFKDIFLVKYLAYCVIEKNEPWQIKELIPIGAIKNARNNPK